MEIVWQIVLTEKGEASFSDDVYVDPGLAMAMVDSWLGRYEDQTWEFENGEWTRYSVAGVRAIVAPRGVVRV